MAFTEDCEIEGNIISKKYLYELAVTAEDSKYLPDTAKDTYRCCEKFGELFSRTDDDAISIEITMNDLFWFYQRKLSGMMVARTNLREQRNHYYAHLDKAWSLEKVTKEKSVLIKDIEAMISFSMELCRTVIALLTGTSRAVEPINIDDLENTLEMVRLGVVYQQKLPDEVYGRI